MAKKKESKFRSMVSSDSKKQQRQGSSYGYLTLPKGVNVYSAEPGGRVTLDIIPYIVSDERHPDRDDNTGCAVPGECWYKRPFSIHRNIGVGKDSVVCLTSFGKRCPICDYRSKLMKNGAPREETDLLKPSKRNLYVVIPVGNKKLEATPMIWDISQFLFQNLLNDELEENEDNAVFPDLEEGLSLKIRFDSKTIGGGNAFAEASRIDFLERKNQYEVSILDEIPNLDNILQELSAKELDIKFMELEDEDVAEAEDQEDDDEDAAPVRKRKSNDTSKSHKPIAKDEEEDEDDDQEEEEEEPAPVRRKKPVETAPVRRKPAVVKDEEEEEEDEDDDEEEEPAPAPVRKKKVTEPAPTGKKKERCPYGHKFGVDTDQFDDCEDCEIWNDCDEVSNKK